MSANDPSTFLAPGQPYIVNGLDWSWAFVVYREVPGRSGYVAGTNGTVWSCRKNLGREETGDGYYYKLRPISDGKKFGYKQVKLCGDAPHKMVYIHEIILTTFVGPRPSGPGRIEACHRNGDGSDNRLDNLRWDTHRSNMQDLIGHGRSIKGIKHPLAKLTETDVRIIRELSSDGWPYHFIAREYGVTVSSIHLIVKRKQWSHIA